MLTVKPSGPLSGPSGGHVSDSSKKQDLSLRGNHAENVLTVSWLWLFFCADWWDWRWRARRWIHCQVRLQQLEGDLKRRLVLKKVPARVSTGGLNKTICDKDENMSTTRVRSEKIRFSWQRHDRQTRPTITGSILRHQTGHAVCCEIRS